MDANKVNRATLPTASFSLTVPQIRWIEEESQRRGVKKSVFVREILDAARSEQADEEAA